MGATIKIELDGVKAKLSSKNIERGRYAMANQMLLDMQPLIPNRDGILQQVGMIEGNGESLSWTLPYAKAQFYGTNGKAVFRKYTTPGTGKRWDLKGKSMFMSDWVNAFTKGAGL